MGLSKIRVSELSNPKIALSILLQFSILLLSVAYPLLYPQKVNATAQLNTFVRFDRVAAGAQLGGVVCLKTDQATSQAETKVIVGFPSTFSIAGTGWSVDTTALNLPSTARGDAFTATAWPGISGPTVVDTATKAAIFASTQLTSTANTYCFHFTSTGSTTGSAGNDLNGSVSTVKVSSNNLVIDNFLYATSILTGTGAELIQVTATVSGQFTFTLSSGAGAGATSAASLPLGVLNSSTTVTTPYRVTATISTNANNGFLSWVKGGGVGLYSSTTGQAITSPGTYDGSPSDLGSTTGYGVFAVTGTNAPTIAAEYNTGDAGTQVGHIDNTAFELMASKTGTQTGTTFTIGVRAKPAAATPPATDYTDVLTVVASGAF
jgi:hypothetical protein